MMRTGLIRLGGLATMVGGVGSYAIVWLPDWLSMLLLGATLLPVIAALRTLHSERYGLARALGSLTVLIGLVLVIASWILGAHRCRPATCENRMLALDNRTYKDVD